jgi:flagellar biosynthesis/type III secretory pathway protein FliH
MSKRCELQKEYYKANGNYKGTGKYSDDYVAWLENEVLALRQTLVVGRSEQLITNEKDAFDRGYTKGWTEGFNSGKLNGD